ncbi:MAG TPA: hypothetical protein VF175_00625 [Lacipirellula sp.]
MALIIVSGAIANKPFNGGEAWVRLNWTLGFEQLGHEVLFIEQLDAGADLERRTRYFQDVMTQFGLERRSALIDANGRPLWGLAEHELTAAADNAAALINISGHLTSQAIKEPIGPKVYVDLDPGFTQFWHEQGNLGAKLDDHEYYYTVGENIGAADCPIPTGGLPWRPVRQPVVIDRFPVVESAAPWRFTTIGSWRGSFGPVEADGKTYGQKVHEFRKFVELPHLVHLPFEVALDIHPTEVNDLALLRNHGWRLVDPREAAGDPVKFRSYVQRSGAEFSVAQGMYVETNSGWFSDRTVRYLASGKPALVQDTGFSRNLPVGEGVLAFRSIEEAVAGAEEIARGYHRHCHAARQIAEQYFDAKRVLGALLEEIGVEPTRAGAPPRSDPRMEALS